MFGFFFTPKKNIRRFAQVPQGDMERFKAFYCGMLNQGNYLAPASYEAGFISIQHSDADIKNTIAAKRVMNKWGQN